MQEAVKHTAAVEKPLQRVALLRAAVGVAPSMPDAHLAVLQLAGNANDDVEKLLLAAVLDNRLQPLVAQVTASAAAVIAECYCCDR